MRIFRGDGKGNVGIGLLFALVGVFILIMILPLLASSIDIGNLSSALVTISKNGYIAFAAGEYSDIISKLSHIIFQINIIDSMSNSINETLTEQIDAHIHNTQLVAPWGTDPIILISGAGAYNFGNYFELLPAGITTNLFDLHWIVVSNISSNEDYEIQLYYGSANITACSVTFSRTNVQTSSITLPLLSHQLPAGSAISARMRDGYGGNSANAKIFYHEYD